MPEQTLLFDRPAPKAAEFSDEITAMTLLLRGRGWVTRKLIERATGWDEKFIRDVAHASEGRIISGNKGYKLFAECTPEEFSAARGRLKSQVDRMNERIIAMDKMWHRRDRT